MEEKSAFESFELDVNKEIKGYLAETAKWAYFMSIIGFIGIGLMVFGGIIVAVAGGAMGNAFESAYGIGSTVGVAMVYIVLALIYFFPVLYLFKFGKNMKSALKQTNNNDFKAAFLNLKSHYKFMGIFTIVIISIYILAFIGGGLAAAML
ncbi:DUF5362 family protein [Seonamhaeicola marinus]|uniref:DUF5362 domain-containing protein n=1 Tax=Seonamhaeicola marinus TaxID=1912246 RepID=A0A5D0HK22_9FLAO|nr:DUF5362 family protein [Seonamhaeicola marinus]TYA71671.1 hypothetical protein FUA24_19090 [Seonamhaeicola marinus]